MVTKNFKKKQKTFTLTVIWKKKTLLKGKNINFIYLLIFLFSLLLCSSLLQFIRFQFISLLSLLSWLLLSLQHSIRSSSTLLHGIVYHSYFHTNTYTYKTLKNNFPFFFFSYFALGHSSLFWNVALSFPIYFPHMEVVLKGNVKASPLPLIYISYNTAYI